MKILILFCCIVSLTAAAQDAPYTITGTVLSSDEKALPGTAVKVKNSNRGAITDANGNFSFELEQGRYILQINFIGYERKEVEITVPSEKPIHILLEEDVISLKEVEIISTGYQELPKERATGSFAQLDESLINRAVSTNVLQRIEDVTSGLILNRDIEGREGDINIRGTSTLFANSQPLIIVDNFPYDGPLENINPNDVSSITVLKDAAAASIWGARAGNGVIVITTKKGRPTDKPQISFNSNITVGEKPDLHCTSQMSSSEFIEVQQLLFERGFYNSAEQSNAHIAISPVVEILIDKRDGVISSEEAENMLNNYRQQDARNDLEKYYYQNSINQQYAVNVNGGSEVHNYFFSAGFDRNLSSLKENVMNRLTLNTKQSWKLLKDKLTANVGINFVKTAGSRGTELPSLYPYDFIANDEGEAIPVIRDFRKSYVEGIEESGLLNWQYYPLREIGLSTNEDRALDYRINTSIGYKILHGLNAEVLYQYWQNSAKSEYLRPVESYYTRNLINQFTQVSTNGSLSRAVPEGGILDIGESAGISHSFRGQLSFNRRWSNNHEINALGGYELKSHVTNSNSTRYYGYDDELRLSTPVDYITRYSRYNNPASRQTIPNNDDHSGFVDRFVSFYGNAAYTYKNRYTVSASARKDASNLFGVKTNQKGVPLWSVGGSWSISEESFYGISWLPYLRFRSTYGYNGNIDKSVTAYTTAVYRVGSFISLIPGLPYAQITNPPNPELRWERIRIFNTGLDFEFKEGMIGGSFEYFHKIGLDLIGTVPFAPSSGVSSFRGNFADTKTHGFDIVLTSKNVSRAISWETTALFSHINEQVTGFDSESSINNYLHYGSGDSGLTPTPLKGNPLYSIYSYAWAGLDPDTGAPLGYFDGEPSDDYTAIINEATPEALVHHGSGRPTTFGSIRNNLEWKGFSLSFNITYRLGYFFRRKSIDYGAVLAGYPGHGDYTERWQQPGDEEITDIPSMPAASVNNQNSFYRYSSVLVERGDHIRFQDIAFSYTLNDSRYKNLPFSQIELYSYINNIGIIWKASDKVSDPDYRFMPAPKTIAVGLRMNF